MSVRYSKYFPFAVLLADLILLNLALVVSIYVTYGIYPIYRNFLNFGIIANVIWVIASLWTKSYLVARPLDLKTHLSRLLLTLTYYLVGIMGCIWFFKFDHTPRPTFIDFYLFYTVFVLAGRTLLFVMLNNLRKRGFDHKKILVIGDNDIFERVENLFKTHPEYGYDIVNFISLKDINNISADERIAKFLKGNPDEIFICYEEFNDRLLKSVIRFGKTFSVKIKLISDSVLEQQFIPILNYGNLQVLHVTSQPKITSIAQVIKRVFDIGFSFIVMITGFPVFLTIYLITKFTSDGPAFFKQERIGKDNKPFTIYKFRSMTVNAERFGPRLSSADDSRITKWGRVIRRTRIDELPQFWNVLKGDMSVVGHRPERQYFIDKIVEINPNYKTLLWMRPGITSIGQVKYGYAENVDQMCERLRYDLLYQPNLSLNHDFQIILKTIKVMVQGKGK